MAIQISPRIAVYAGVGALVGAGAAAWFLFLQEDAPPAPPPAAKKAPAGKAANGTAAASRADAASKAAAGKAAPIPAEPDKLVAEILDASGVKNQIGALGAEVAASALSASHGGGLAGGEPPEPRLAGDVALRHFDPAAMAEELANGVKSGYEAERMGRFLELLRQPSVAKLAQLPVRALSPEERARFADQVRRNALPPARQKLVQALDELLRVSDLGVHLTLLSAREMVDGVFEGLQQAGRRVSKEARQAANAEIGSAEPQVRNAFRALLVAAYRDLSDEELGEYLKLLDSETGRWGWQILSGALRSTLEKRARPFGRDLAQLVLAQQLAGKPATPKETGVPARAQAVREAPKAAPVAAAPAEPAGYQRPASIRPLYTRYNDLVTAVVMRDAQAVRELLADGKDPNARQSDGLTVLMIAVANGDAAIAELLLAHRADANLRGPGGRSALEIARAHNRAELVRLLERHGARG